MRFLTFFLVWFALVLALPVPGYAMGSGPHPTVPYGIPQPPAHGPEVIAATTAGDSPAAPSIWDHQIYVIALVIAGGELLLWVLMVAGKASRRGEND